MRLSSIRIKYMNTVIVVLLFGLFSFPVGAGELECGIGGCRLDGLARVEWKPSSSCYKPPAPLMLVTGTREYNEAVDAFNRWVSEMGLYVDCVSNEAASDLKKMPDIILEGVKKTQREVSEDVAQQRGRLRLMRQ